MISFVEDNRSSKNENSIDIIRLEQANENVVDLVPLQETIESPDIDLEQLQHEIQTRKEFLDHLTTEFDQGNYQHVHALLNNTRRIKNIMSDIQEAKAKRKRARTWKDAKPWTMFLE